MQGIPLFFLFPTLSEMEPLLVFDYSNNSFSEHWEVCINVTTRFGYTKLKQEIAVNPLPQIIFHFRKPSTE